MTRAGPYRSRPGSPPGCCGFLPSRDGFAFTNAWPPGPAVTVPTPLRGIGIGNAAAGLCGGMVFAALDYWHARVRPPAARPEPGSPLYNYIVRRLIASWRIPAGVARYYQWMNAAGRRPGRHGPRPRPGADPARRVVADGRGAVAADQGQPG